MHQRFNTRNYSVRDFEEWRDRDELVLAPKFQRREVWNGKAKSFLVDTILRGKPIPKLYMRQEVNPASRRTTREIVDGQQRLATVLSFVRDGFKISRTHNAEHGGKYFSDLDTETQSDFLQYEFVVDLLQDMRDNEIYDVFARLNTYSERLKDQELRNAGFFGEFKTSVYGLAQEYVTFLRDNRVFTPRRILRMAEAEFISELLLAVHEGIREGNKPTIDAAYKKYDDSFTGRKTHEKRFRETMDTIREVFVDDLPQSNFRATRFLYPLFCAVYHMKFGLPKLSVTRRAPRKADYPKLKAVLDDVDELVLSIRAAEQAHEDVELSLEDKKFNAAYSEHWVHASNRTVITKYLNKRLVAAIR